MSSAPLVHGFTSDYEESPALSSESALYDANSPQSPPAQARQRSAFARSDSLSPGGYRPTHFTESQDGDIGVSIERPHGLGLSEDRYGNQNEPLESTTYHDDEERDRFVSGGSVRSLPYSFTSSNAPLNDQYRPLHKAKVSDSGHLSPGNSTASRTAYADFSAHLYCPSREHIWKGAGHYLYITLVILSVFSTLFSGLYLGIAIARPRYGKFISDGGNLTYANSTLLFALFGKLIELSFVTVFIAFIGQVISKRAFNRSKGHGVTLAEISMRGWVMQPGQMLTHPDALKAAIGSTMGIMSLCAALTAMLYTTATSALVTPQLSPGKFATLNLQGLASHVYGDMSAVVSSCASPVQVDQDGYGRKQQACVGPLLAAASNNDWSSWLASWTGFANTTSGSDDLRHRPFAYSLVSDNTTVTGPWIEIENMTVVSDAYHRTINNISLAMPHAGVIDAIFNPVNRILQPKANDGFGSYDIHASVWSPAINVLCAEMTDDDLAPLVYEKWPHAENLTSDMANWNNVFAPNPQYVPSYGPTEWLNRTVVDEIFGFGPTFGHRRPPIFPRLPSVYNTLVNTSGAFAPLDYRDAVYVLGGIPSPDTGKLSNYSLCSLRSYRTPSCSTWFNVTSSSSKMEAYCEHADDQYQFSQTVPAEDVKSGNETTSLFWIDMADSWLEAISLGNGITDGDGSNSRILTQLFPTSRSLNPKMPSMAEALAVMAGNTLLTGARNSPLRDMTDSATPTNNTEAIVSRIQSQQYASGATQNYQNLFFIVLAEVFVGNILVLAWLIWNRGLVTDFSDPANMFSVSINSPPSHIFAGSCGGGPEGKQYRAKWFVNVDGDHVFIENDERERELAEHRVKRTKTSDTTLAPSPIVQTFSKLSTHRSFL